MIHDALFVAAGEDWSWLGGASFSHDEPGLRPSPEPASVALLRVRGSGWLAGDPSRGRAKGVHHAQIQCAPQVATVIVERGDHVRRVSSADGLLWVGVLWTDDVQPSVRALDDNGTVLASLGPDSFRRRAPARHQRR